jgi:hypothetical protein
MSYSLRVEEGEVEGPGWGDVATTPIALGESIDGAHDENDAIHPERQGKMDIYTLTLDEAGSVEVTLNSELFDTYLEIRSTDNDLLHSNDDYNGLNSRILARLEAGTYHVVATQFSQGEGIYTLAVSAGAEQVATVRSIAVGDTVPVDTSEAAALSEWGDASVYYEFNATQGQEITIRLTSDELDPLLTLTDVLGDIVAMNDDADGSLNARITVTIPRDGLYTIRAGDLGGSQGMMQLSLSEGLEGESMAPYSDPYGYGAGYGGDGSFGAYEDELFLEEMMHDH